MLTSFTLFASKAWAMAPKGGEGAEGGGGGGLGMFIPLLLMGFVLYFFMIRPQSKKQKEHQNLLNRLEKGNKVLTRGGIEGIITGIKENEITIEIAPQIRIKINRGYIDRVGAGGGSNSNPPNAIATKDKDKDDSSASKPDYKV